MKKLLFILMSVVVVTSTCAQNKIAYLDLYQRGGGAHLRTSLMYNNAIIYIGRTNLGEILNWLSQLGWKVDHTLIGANRVLPFPTRHKFHIILKKEYEESANPYVGLTSFDIKNNNDQKFSAIPSMSKIAPTSILYKSSNGKPISVKIVQHSDVINNYVNEQGIITCKDTITCITHRCFRSSLKLKSVTLPESVTEIENSAFAENLRLTSIYCQSTVPPTLGKNSLPYNEKLIIYVPLASVNAYKNAKGWSQYASKIIGYNFTK